MNAVIYVLFQTDKQADEGYSLPSQIKACRAYAESNNLRVIEEQADQESGSTMQRRGSIRILDLCNSGAVKALIVYSLDRLSRDYIDGLMMLRNLQALGIVIHVVENGLSLSTNLLTNGASATS